MIVTVHLSKMGETFPYFCVHVSIPVEKKVALTYIMCVICNDKIRRKDQNMLAAALGQKP